MRALPGTPVGGLFPPRLPPAIGEGQPHMAEQEQNGEQGQTTTGEISKIQWRRRADICLLLWSNVSWQKVPKVPNPNAVLDKPLEFSFMYPILYWKMLICDYSRNSIAIKFSFAPPAKQEATSSLTHAHVGSCINCKPAVSKHFSSWIALDRGELGPCRSEGVREYNIFLSSEFRAFS